MTASPKARLTPTEISTYREQGLVIPDYRVPPDMLERMRSAVDKLLADHPDVKPEQLSGPHNPWGQSTKVLGNQDWLDFCCHPDLLDMVEQLIGPDIVLWGSQLFCKPPGIGMAVPWHQDGQYWPIDPLATVTVRIAIDDSLPENGCMRYIPGSHLARRVARHELVERADVALRQEIAEIDESTACDDVLSAGQISLHDVYLLHGSQANHSKLRRADYAIRYMPASSLYVRDPDWPSNVYAAQHSTTMNYITRPLWLLRGSDRAGNDYQIGHGVPPHQGIA